MLSAQVHEANGKMDAGDPDDVSGVNPKRRVSVREREREGQKGSAGDRLGADDFEPGDGDILGQAFALMGLGGNLTRKGNGARVGDPFRVAAVFPRPRSKRLSVPCSFHKQALIRSCCSTPPPFR